MDRVFLPLGSDELTDGIAGDYVRYERAARNLVFYISARNKWEVTKIFIFYKP